MSTRTCLVVLAFVGLASGAVNPPKEWKLCPRSDPNMNECLKGAITHAIRILGGGDRKLGVLPLEPLHLDKLVVDQASGPVAINLQFDHVDIAGTSFAIVDKVDADWDKVRIELDAHLEDPGHTLTVTGHYSIDGKILVLPIQGNGPCDLKFEKLKVKIILEGEKTEKDGETYVDFKDVNIDFETSKLHIKLDNLFNGDKALGDQANVFLNENWAQILDELKPAVGKALGAAAAAVANTVFHKVPLNQLAPP